jgi:ubiquinone/menaquinone biosynthesis C-methylase UbiE
MLSGIGAVTGLDIDPDVKNNRWLAHAFVFTGGRMPFADQSFDACCSNYVLEHVENPVASTVSVRQTCFTMSRLARA